MTDDGSEPRNADEPWVLVERRLVTRIENVELRQALVEAQMTQLNSTLEGIPTLIISGVEGVLNGRRAERIQDIKGVFGRAKSVALYVTALGNAILILAAIYVLVMGNPL